MGYGVCVGIWYVGYSWACYAIDQACMDFDLSPQWPLRMQRETARVFPTGQTFPTQINPGITAFLFPTLSFPNLLSYHLFPCNALGNMVAISLIKNVRAG